jgi:biofilm protein TabA
MLRFDPGFGRVRNARSTHATRVIPLITRETPLIVDHLDNSARYVALGPLFEQAFDFLRTTDLNDLEPGRYPLAGDALFALVQGYHTKALSEGFWEAHRRYIDLQFVLQGTERIGYAPLRRMQLESHDEQRDLSVLKGEGDLLTLTEGCFMLLWPEDVHMPGLQADRSGPVRKIVCKIAV